MKGRVSRNLSNQFGGTNIPYTYLVTVLDKTYEVVSTLPGRARVEGLNLFLQDSTNKGDTKYPKSFLRDTISIRRQEIFAPVKANNEDVVVCSECKSNLVILPTTKGSKIKSNLPKSYYICSLCRKALQEAKLAERVKQILDSKKPTKTTEDICKLCGTNLTPLKEARTIGKSARLCKDCRKAANLIRCHKEKVKKPEKVRTPHLSKQGYPIAVTPENRYRAEHKVVMERELGRPLRQGEKVHHKNTNRGDNSPSNLELWVRTHPSGARAHDLFCPYCKHSYFEATNTIDPDIREPEYYI